MSIPWRINFYIDITSLNELRVFLENEITKLTESYFALESEVSNIETEEIWSGSSYDSFKEKFDEWKVEYLQSVTQIAMMKQYLEDIVSLGEELIEERDNLSSYLEVK